MIRLPGIRARPTTPGHAAWGIVVVLSWFVASSIDASPGWSSNEDLQRLEDQVMKVVEKATPSVVQITAGTRSGTMATGVVFDPTGLVLTAGHVVRGNPRRLMVVFPDGTRRRGRIVSGFFEDDVDLGLIAIIDRDDDRDDDWDGWPFSPLAPAGSIESSEWIVTLGHAAAISSDEGRVPATRIGRVIGLERAELAIDSPIDAGDSGGPILDLEGRIVGIASRCGHLPWQNLATSIDAIHAWMPHLMDPEVEPPSSLDWEGRTRRRSPRGTRRDPEFLSGLDSIAAPSASLLVEIRDQERLVSHGTIIAPDRVITKASQFARHVRTPRVVRPGDADARRIEFQARPIGIDPDLDLLLLEVPGLSGRLEIDEPEVRSDALLNGSMLVIPEVRGGASAIAVVARDREELITGDAADDRPFLGVGTTSSPDGGLRVVRVVANTAAARAGLMVDDIIRRVDGRTVRRTADLLDTIVGRGIGDGLRIEIERGGKSRNIEIDLGLRPDATRSGIPSNTSIATSRLSSGFGPIHLIDADRPIAAVGGVVVDLEGGLAGWLAARRSRTSMVIVPWPTIVDAVAAIDEPESSARMNVPERLCSYRVVGTPNQRGIIRLDAEDAFPDGDTLRREKLGPQGQTTWGSWKDWDDALEWAISVDTPGRWQVRMTIACPRRQAGTPIRLTIGEQAIDARVEQTDGWEDFRQFDLGVVEITDIGDAVVRLEPTGRPRDAVANVLGIELRRIAENESDDPDDDNLLE